MAQDKVTGQSGKKKSIQTNLEKIGPANQDWAKDYVAYRQDVDGASPHTLANHARALAKIDAFIDGDSLEHSSEECGAWARKFREFKRYLLEEGKGGDGYAESTVSLWLVAVRVAVTWLHHSDEHGTIPAENANAPAPDCVAWIQGSTGATQQDLNRADILDPDEIRAMADAADHPRDAALVMLGYETGARASELMALQVKDVDLDIDPPRVSIPKVKDGTVHGRRRNAELFYAGPYLLDLLSNHPLREHREAPLWYSVRQGDIYDALEADREGQTGEAFDDLGVGTDTYSYTLKKLADRVGIEKPVSPHRLRDAMATHLAERGFNEFQLREYFGWSKSSDMPTKYVRVAKNMANDRRREEHGYEPEDPAEVDDPLTPDGCPWCEAQVSPGAQYCSRCGRTLDRDEVHESSLPDGTEIDPERFVKAARALGYKNAAELRDAPQRDIMVALALAREDRPATPSSGILGNERLIELFEEQVGAGE